MNTIIQQILSFFSKNKTEGAAAQAKDRLKVVVKKDRVKITPQAMQEMRKDIIKTITQFVEIEEDNLEISIEQEGTSTSLVANIPVKGGRAEINGKKKTIRPRQSTAKKKKATTKKRAATKRKSTKKKTKKAVPIE
jgi:cell division topological specificity factor